MIDYGVKIGGRGHGRPQIFFWGASPKKAPHMEEKIGERPSIGEKGPTPRKEKNVVKRPPYGEKVLHAEKKSFWFTSGAGGGVGDRLLLRLPADTHEGEKGERGRGLLRDNSWLHSGFRTVVCALW